MTTLTLDLITPKTSSLPHIKSVERIGETLPGGERKKVGIEYLSPSAFKKHTMCPAKFLLHYREGLRERDDSNMVRGSAVHEAQHAFAWLLREKQRFGHEIVLDELLAIAKQSALDYLKKHVTDDLKWKGNYNSSKTKHTPETLREAVLNGVDLLARERWINLVPVEIESGYIIHWDEDHLPTDQRTLPILAYADIIEHVVIDDVVNGLDRDLKTGARKTQDDIDLDFALTAHCAAYEIYHGIPTRTALYDNLVCNATQLYETLTTTRTEANVRRMYRIARALTNAIRSGAYVPVDNSKECGSCDFRERCHKEYA